MGCGCSSEGMVAGPSGYNDDSNFIQEAEYSRSKFDKKNGIVKEV